MILGHYQPWQTVPSSAAEVFTPQLLALLQPMEGAMLQGWVRRSATGHDAVVLGMWAVSGELADDP